MKLKLKNTNFMKNELYMIYNVGINKILVSKVSCGKKDFKCFIGYKDGKKKETVMRNASKNEHIWKRFWWN